MCKPELSSRRRCAALAGALVLTLCAAPGRTRGQAAVETAGAASSSAAMATSAPKVLPKSLPNPAIGNNSPSLPVSRGPSLDETNRRNLERRAGKDAAKLLLQSVPNEARIDIDGSFVGRTPLLLIVPPGKYKVEMRGQQREFGERLIELQPNETQQVALTLALHYSASVTANPRAPSSFVGGARGGTQVFSAPSPQPAAENDSSTLATLNSASFNEAAKLAQARESRYPSNISAHPRAATPFVGGTAAGPQGLAAPSQRAAAETGSAPVAVAQGPSPDPGEVNRKALEQRAGKDAATLLLQSLPSNALAYIDGSLVGRTPLQLLLAPGRYKVEMQGQHEEVGERLIGLLPNETQQLALTLVSYYPASITVQY
jgi:hypothetical protein